MARKKVKLEWIANDSARRATFKKRRKGLTKKVSELSTLCDVKACMIVYGPNEPEAAEVWPSVADAMRVLSRLKRLPEMEQSKKMMDQEGFMRQRIEKLKEQLRKQDKENREMETSLLMYQGLTGRSLHDVRIEDVTSLAWLVEMKVNQVQKRVGFVEGEIAAQAAKAVVEEKAVKEEVNGRQKTAMETAMEELQRQEWFPQVMNSHEQMFSWGQMVNSWLDAYYPLN